MFLTAALVGYTLNLFPSGAAVDGFGERRVMVASLLALAGGTVAVSFAPTYLLLLGAAVLLEGAYATAMPASNKGIVASAPRGRENLAMGVKQVGVTAGSGAASLVVTGVAAVLAVTQTTGSAGRVGAGSLADRFGGASGAATVSLAQLGGAAALFGWLAVGVTTLPFAAVVFGALGLTVLGMTGVDYSCMGDLVPSEDVGAATAGGQMAINVGGLLAPPAFGYLADTVGYRVGWAALAVLAAFGMALLWGRREIPAD